MLTGKDIIEQLKDKDLGSCVWATNRILNDEQTVTLDDMTLDSGNTQEPTILISVALEILKDKPF